MWTASFAFPRLSHIKPARSGHDVVVKVDGASWRRERPGLADLAVPMEVGRWEVLPRLLLLLSAEGLPSNA
jgi:hypothetical protein